MSSRHSINHVSIAELIIVRGLDDWVQACEVVSELVQTGQKLSYEEVTEVSLAAIDHLLRENLMEAGDVGQSDGFCPWPEPSEQAFQLVTTAWHGLGRLPNLGEVCWLRNTSKGDALAKQLSA